MPTTVFVANIRGLHQVLEEHGTDHAVRLLQTFADSTQEIIEQLGGNLVNIWGDEAFVLFRTPQQAVRAAVEAHKRYDEVRLPGGGSLGVAIGIATGQVTYVLTGHIGRPIKRAAQLCALAGPRQTFTDAGIRDMMPQMAGVVFRETTGVPPSAIISYIEITEMAAVQ